MAKELLTDLLSSRISLDSFNEWISGKENKDISSSLIRTDFVLHTLNYIQEGASRFIIQNTTAKERGTSSTKEPNEDLQKKLPVDILKTPENKSEFNNRKPFQVINAETPTNAAIQPLSVHLNQGIDSRRKLLNCTATYNPRNISTSTPVHKRNSGKDHFAHHQGPISPQSTNSSLHSDQSFASQTSRSSKSSGKKFNRSGGSQRFSPQSYSPTFSPTSPQYPDSFPVLGSRGRPRASHSPQSHTLTDFIVSKPKSQKDRKRIKPTQLITAEEVKPSSDISCAKEIFGEVNRPFVPITSTLHSQDEVKQKSNFEEERNLLKEKRSNLVNVVQPTQSPVCDSPGDLTDEQSATPRCEQTTPKQILVRNPSVATSPLTKLTVEPDPSKVVYADRLVRLASVYSACLDSNLVPNVTTELYLVLTLLTCNYKFQSQVKVSDNTLKEMAKDSVDPGVEGKQCKLSLQQLCLDETMQSVVDISHEEINVSENRNLLSWIHNCVMFAAVVIEKQVHVVQNLDKTVIRLLLENTRLSMFLPHFIPHLTRIAETKEANEAQNTLCRKPSVLTNRSVLYNTETDNKNNFSSDMNYFSFKKQRDGFYEILHEWRTKNSDNLWISKKFPQKVQQLLNLSSDPVNLMHLARLLCTQLTSSSSEQCSSELELPGVTKDKLSRLEARFSKPLDSMNGPRPSPQFPGEQMFYQHFLQFAAGSPFLTHMVDYLSHQLGQLDSTAFYDEGSSEEEIKAQVLTCLSDCCLLAKFLGLAVFLPYRSGEQPPPEALQAQVLIRQTAVPPVDIHTYLQCAVTRNRLLVTVPWVVAYLGMMDAAAPLLPCYRLPLQLLADLYLSLPLPHVSPLSCLLLRCVLGWLFDVSFFPEDVFLSLINSGSSSQLQGRSCEPSDVDVKDVVDQTVLSEVCPFLGSLRLLLSASSGAKRGTVRHIRPVPAQHAQTSVVTPRQTLEMKLEESFLSGQSPSFRATVEFVVERVSSSCIKHICSNVIAPCKEKALTSFNQKKVKNKKFTKEEVQSLVEEVCQTTLAQIQVALDDHCGVQVGQVLAILLGPDASNPSVFRSACDICSRRCRERTVNWLNSHIKLAEIFSKMFNEKDAKHDEDQVMDRKNVEHRDSAMSPPDLLIELQERMCQCIENRGSSISEQEVLALISSTLETVRHRSDLLLHAEQILYSSTVDYCIILLAHCPGVVTAEVLQQLCSLWSTFASPLGCPLERVLSCRNVLLLCQTGSKLAVASWTQLAYLLVQLLKEELLTPKQVESQFVALFNKEWPPMVHTLMASCLSCMLELIRRDLTCKKNPKFVLLLEWAHEVMTELGKEDICEDS